MFGIFQEVVQLHNDGMIIEKIAEYFRYFVAAQPQRFRPSTFYRARQITKLL